MLNTKSGGLPSTRNGKRSKRLRRLTQRCNGVAAELTTCDAGVQTDISGGQSVQMFVLSEASNECVQSRQDPLFETCSIDNETGETASTKAYIDTVCVNLKVAESEEDLRSMLESVDYPHFVQTKRLPLTHEK